MFPLKDNLRCLTFPLVTVLLIAANCAAFIWETIQLSGGAGDSMLKWMLVPSTILNAFGSGDPYQIKWAVVAIFSHMFLHGGLMHLAGNMIFLFTFGKAVEARLGRLKFLGFYLLGGLAAAAAQIASDPTTSVPMLGASGAIAGVLGGYLLMWPKADITGFVLPMFVVRIRAYWFLLAWFIMQFLPIIQSGGDLTGAGVAYWAHIGGFIGGVVLGGIARLIQPVSDVCYIPTDCPPCDNEQSDEDN
ncbi:rhomboid family intramembrane serine protease [Candidatus Obscuribacterales bacterium]|nr:rhomboid family intramembrane serine protease [Candidatus Obscuribacterales bacterium]